MKILITGSCGLVGSACHELFTREGWDVLGVDNLARQRFFPGVKLDVRDDTALVDIRHREPIDTLVKSFCPDLIVHAAAQPSHDLAARIPFLDFETNAVGTLNLLEAARWYCPEAPFVFLSTNKVYGDRPNCAPNREETERRFDFLPTVPRAAECSEHGVSELMRVDQSTHSLFGCSKLAADILVQEYGRYFDMPTVCLRAGCLTGPQHAGVELHGFLSYLIECNVRERPYLVFGYKGKQVRDNLHAEDVARFAMEFYRTPRKAAVYNIGGGYANSCSILEAFDMAREVTGKMSIYTYRDEPRIGDHICYYSDLRKIKADYPGWSVTHDLQSIFREIAEAKTL